MLGSKWMCTPQCTANLPSESYIGIVDLSRESHAGCAQGRHSNTRSFKNMSSKVGFPAAEIAIGSDTFPARWEAAASPRTCAAFQRVLPFSQKIIHARWSGEACWIPLGTLDLAVGLENPISRPEPGQILFYPSGISETEILVPYGHARFNSVAGELAGNHFLTIVGGLDRLAQLGRDILWYGSRDIRFSI